MKRNLIKLLAELFFPPKCAACGEVTLSAKVLCDSCLEKYSLETKYTCPSCGGTAVSCSCGDLPHLICLTFYKGYYGKDDRVTEKLIFALKCRKNAALADLFAVDMAFRIIKDITQAGGNTKDYELAHLPRGQKNFEKYGFDHAELLCDKISKYTGMRRCELFARHGGAEQKKMGQLERLSNAETTLDLMPNVSVDGRRIILIDDIVTTGATMKKATKLLHDAGAVEVMCAVIAKTARKGGGRA